MTKAARYWLGLAMGVLIGSVGFPAHAQQANDRGVTQSNQSQSAKKPAKPAATRPAGVRSTVDPRAPHTRQWTIDDALPRRTTREPATATAPALGRVPVEGGTFGFSADQQLDPYKTPDGNQIRGHSRMIESEPSYLGLSLSVRTDDKSFVPRTVLPSW